MKTVPLIVSCLLTAATTQAQQPVQPVQPVQPAQPVQKAPVEKPLPLPGALDFTNSGRIGSFTFDAKESSTGRTIKRNYDYGYGDYDRDFSQRRTIAVDATALRTPSTPVEVEIMWFAQKLADKSLFIYSRQSKQVKVSDTARFGKLEFDSPELASNVVSYYGLGARYVTGSKYAGWLAILRDPSGAVMRHRASNTTIDAVTKDPEAMAARLAAYAAALSKK